VSNDLEILRTVSAGRLTNVFTNAVTNSMPPRSDLVRERASGVVTQFED
jgi:hypothetical protein